MSTHSKSARWTRVQKAAAFDTTVDNLETFAVTLSPRLRRFASRMAKKLGMPRDVFIGLLLKWRLMEKGVIPAEAKPSAAFARVLAMEAAS